jgi:membrane-bound metal-dependent hydrolase YbcI (DUF457 family)
MSPTGHLALGFASKPYASNIPLPILLSAAYAIDLLYFITTSLKLESFEFNPWTHSLGMSIFWSLFFGAFYYLFIKDKKQAIFIGLLVFSHWVLDFIVWDNLPLFFNPSQRLGLGLYPKIGFSMTSIQFNTGSILATSLELTMFVIGFAIYWKNRKNSHKT